MNHTYGTIAVCEDPFVRKLLNDLLKRRGYRVIDTSSAHLVELLQQGTEPIDVVITNCPAEFLQFADWLPVLYIAAAPDPELVAPFRHCLTLHKPFVNENLLQTIDTLCALPV